MPSTYSSLLRLEMMATGEKSATWGDITNTNLGTLLEKSIAGLASVNVTAGNVTLTALNGTDDESRCAIISVTGTPGVSRNVVAPSSAKLYAVINGSNAAIVFKGAATSGVTMSAGEKAWLAWNGSDFVAVGVPVASPSFTGQINGPAGSVGAPGYTFTGDSNTGIYSAGADALSMAAGGVQRAGVNTTGLFVSSAAASDASLSLQAISFARDWRLKVKNADGNLSIQDFTSGFDRVILQTDGKMVLNTPAGAYAFRLVDSGGVGDRLRIFMGTAGNGTIIETTDNGETTTARPITLGATNGTVNLGGASQFTKDGSGNVGIGAASVGAAKLWVQPGAGSGIGLFQDFDGKGLIAGYSNTGTALGMRVAGSAGLFLSGNGANVDHVTLDSSGNVGIGATPTHDLDISKSGQTISAALRAGAGQAAILYLAGNNGSTGTSSFDIQMDSAGNADIVQRNNARLSIYTNGAERLRLNADGSFYGTALHNVGTPTGTTTQYIASGTYTPSLTNVANISASTARQCQWMRVGNVVTVGGQFDATHTSTGTVVTEVGISLPISSAFTTAYQCGGTSTSYQPGAVGFVNAQSIEADATNDRAKVRWANAGISGSTTYTFSFTYEVL